jgi:ribose transport system permease protein
MTAPIQNLAGRVNETAERPQSPLRREWNAPAFTVILCATLVLFLASWAFEPQSVSQSAINGMLPFAAVLAIAAIGQTLVIQQGGIDLSVPGMISLTVVIMTQYPAGDSQKLAVALLLAYGTALVAGFAAGFIVSRIGITAIVATLGLNALEYGSNLQISKGTTETTTPALQSFTSGSVLGIPTPVVVAIILTCLVAFVIKRTVVGRRFEAVGANASAARAAGLEPRGYQIGAYVGANLLYCSAGVLLAGIISAPSAFQGDSYLLPSVAAVVLGGTSLLGGPGSAVATAIGALFLSQLDQFVLTTGLSSAVQYLVQAAALAIGIAIYSVHWGPLKERIGAIFGGRGAAPSGAAAEPDV